MCVDPHQTTYIYLNILSADSAEEKAQAPRGPRRPLAPNRPDSSGQHITLPLSPGVGRRDHLGPLRPRPPLREGWSSIGGDGGSSWGRRPQARRLPL